MEIKKKIGGLLFSLFVISFALFQAQDTEAAISCSVSIPAASANIAGNLNVNFTNDDMGNNITRFNITMTGADSNAHTIIAALQRLDDAAQESALNESGNYTFDTTTFAEQIYTITVNGFDDTAAGTPDTTCTQSFTIDNADISAPTIESGPNSSTIVEVTDAPITFNVTSGLANEQFNAASLLVAGNTFTMTLGGVNSTQAFVTLREDQIPSGTWDYTITATDTDGSTTSTVSQTAIVFNFDPTGIGAAAVGSILAEDEEAKKKQGGTLLLVLALVAVVLAVAKKK